MEWGLLIIIYLFLGGIAGGSFIASTMSHLGYLGKSKKEFENVGFKMAPIAIAVGSFLLLLDLAPSAIIKAPFLLLMHPSSVMGFGMYALCAFLAVSAYIYLQIKNKQHVTRSMLTLGSVLALAVMGYTGFLLAVVEAKPMWNTIWLPILFTVSALSTGFTYNSLMSHFTNKEISKVHFYTILAEIFALVMYIYTVSSGAVEGKEGIQNMVAGTYSAPFWILLIGAGILYPLKANMAAMTNAKVDKLAEIGTLVGGFTLRAVVLSSAVFINVVI